MAFLGEASSMQTRATICVVIYQKSAQKEKAGVGENQKGA